MPFNYRYFAAALLFGSLATILDAKTIGNEAAEQYLEPGFDWLLHEDVLRGQVSGIQEGEPGALALVAKAMREDDPRAGLALQNYLERYPRDPLAYDLAGTQLLTEGKTREAAIALKRSLELDPSAALTRAKYGASLALLGQLQAASQTLRDAVVQDPQNALAFYWLQRISVTQGDIAAATRYAERALRAFGLPETSVNRAHLDLADLYISQNRWDDVLDLLSPVLRADRLDVPDTFAAEVYGRLTQAATEVGDAALSRAAFERAFGVLPPAARQNLPWPLLESRILRLEGEAAQSLSLLETLVGDNAQARRALIGEIAMAKAATGDVETALDDLIGVMRTQADGETAQLASLYSDIAAAASWPSGSAEALLAAMGADVNSTVLLEGARVEMQTGNTAVAQAQLSALVAAKETPDATLIEAYRLLAGIAYAKEDRDAARAAVRKALELAPQNEQLWLTLAAYTHDPGTHLHAGNATGHGELRAVMIEATEALPDSAAIWAELGIIDFTEGNTDTAADFFLRSLELSPARPEVNVLAALALVDSGGDLELAQSFAEFAHRANPNRAEVLDALGWVKAAKSDDPAPGLALIEAALEIEPSDPTIHRHRAELLQRLDQPGEAAEAALNALSGELAKHDQEGAREILLSTRPRQDIKTTFYRLNTDGSLGDVIGTADMRSDEAGLVIDIDVTDLLPGTNEIHIHEIPNCGPGPDGAPGAAAGPHFGHAGHHAMMVQEDGTVMMMMNGKMMVHTAEEAEAMMMMMQPDGKPRGDLPNLETAADGTTRTTVTVDWLNFDEIRGRSLVIHEGVSTPSGGPPKYACGIIG